MQPQLASPAGRRLQKKRRNETARARSRFRSFAAAADVQRVHRPGESLRTTGAARGSREKTRRRPRAHSVKRAAGARQDDAREHHRERDGHQHQEYERAGDRKGRRAGRFADEPGEGRCPFHRRDPSTPADDRRISLSGDGRLSARYHHRPGTAGAQSAAPVAEVHPHRRDDASGNGERAVAFAIRDDGAARLLPRGRNAEDHPAQRRAAQCRDRCRRRDGNRGAHSRDAANREQSSPLGARLRSSEGRRQDHGGTGRSRVNDARDRSGRIRSMGQADYRNVDSQI